MCFFLGFSGNWLHRVGLSCTINSNDWSVLDGNMRVKLKIVVSILSLVCGTCVVYDQIYRRREYGYAEYMALGQDKRDISDNVNTAVAQKTEHIMREYIHSADSDNVNSTFARKTENMMHIDGVDSDKASTNVASSNGITSVNRSQENPPLEVCPQNPPNLGKYIRLCRCINLAMRECVKYNKFS